MANNNNNYTEPTGSPDSVSFGIVNLTNIAVEWTEIPCEDINGGNITGYTVEYSSTTPFTANITTVSVSTMKLVVGGLLPRTNYTFSVRANEVSQSTSNSTFTSTPTG